MNSETAILIAATLATVGWIYTAHRARYAGLRSRRLDG